MGLDPVDRVIDAVRAGLPVLFPTDTVYGLATSADREEYALRLYRLKRRPQAQPSALLAPDVETLLACVPELRGRSEVIVRALLPGPYTLVLSNPACRYPWLNGERADAIGVRVPDLPRLRSVSWLRPVVCSRRVRTSREGRAPQRSRMCPAGSAEPSPQSSISARCRALRRR